MKNLNTYDEWILNEANKTVEFFKKHPEMLSSIARDSGLDFSKKGEWDPRRTGAIDNERSHEVTKKINKELFVKFKKIGLDIEFNIEDTKRTYNLAGWLSDTETNYNNYDYREFLEYVIKSTPDKFSYDAKYVSKPGYFKGEWEELSFWPILVDKWKQLQNIAKWGINAFNRSKNAGDQHFKNELMKLGLSVKDVEIAMSYVADWTSMSRKRLDKNAWDILHKISVSPKLLPKYVYRGIFYDGAKIKDQKKFLDKWYVGSTPGVSQSKATSWSVDKKTAISFTEAQDFIKDQKNGYYVLLKWKVDAENVIADLRNLPVDHRFWNQQEIIVNPAAKDYEVEAIIPGADEAAHKDLYASRPGGQSGSGRSKKDFITSLFLKIPYDTISVLDRVLWKELCYSTLGEVNSKYGTTLYKNEKSADLSVLNYPIIAWLDRYNVAPAWDFTVISPNELKIKIGIDPTSFGYSRYKGTGIGEMWEAGKAKNPKITYYSNNSILAGDMTIKLVNPSYYGMEFEITLPKKFRVELKENESVMTDTDKLLEDIHKTLGDQPFIDMLINEYPKLGVARNIHYTIK